MIGHMCKRSYVQIVKTGTHLRICAVLFMLFPFTSGPEVIKLFFMLNSTEHEIFPAHKC